MKVNPVGSISLSDASDLINNFKQMSKKDQKRFAQCFNCKNLNVCTKDETDEDENGLCKFYISLPSLPKNKSKDFADVFNREIQRIIKEE